VIPAATFTTPENTAHTVVVGGLLGRHPSAALHRPEATVGEAHALLSLRGGRLVLIALRGSLFVDSEPAGEVVLRKGQSLGLGREVTLRVEALHLPETVLGLAGLGEEPVALDPGPWSILPGPTLAAGLRPEARALLAPLGLGWALLQDGRSRAFGPGDKIELDGHRLTGLDLPLSYATRKRTVVVEAPAGPTLEIEVWRAITRLRAADGHHLDLVGHPARILREIVLNGQPMHWLELAEVLWEEKEVDLRANWRRQLQVLRRKLRVAGIRSDLVRSLGDGRAMLDLRPGDRLVDHTYAEGEGPV